MTFEEQTLAYRIVLLNNNGSLCHDALKKFLYNNQKELKILGSLPDHYAVV